MSGAGVDVAGRARRVRLTVGVLLGGISLLLGLFVRQFVGPERLDPRWLRDHGAVLFDTPRPLARQQLQDQDGDAFDGSGFAGRWNVLFFGFTHCPDVCPTTLALLAEVAARLPADAALAPRFWLVTVDPERDTPALLAPYVRHFDPRFGTLGGDPQAVQRFAAALSVPFARSDLPAGGYTMDHSANLLLIDPLGRFAGFVTPPLERERLVRLLAVLGRHAPR